MKVFQDKYNLMLTSVLKLTFNVRVSVSANAPLPVGRAAPGSHARQAGSPAGSDGDVVRGPGVSVLKTDRATLEGSPAPLPTWFLAELALSYSHPFATLIIGLRKKRNKAS